MSLRGFVLREATLRGAMLRHTDPREVDLTGADLTGADFTGAKLTGATLEGVRAVGAVWTRASLVGAAVALESVERAVRTGGAPVVPKVLSLMALARATVLSVAFSPVGGLLAMVVGVAVWLVDVETHTVLRVLHGHGGPVQSVAFSSDGRRLATGSNDHTARLWDLNSGQTVAIFRGHSDRVQSVAFSPDGRWLATGSDDATARLWDLDSGQTVATIQGHSRVVQSVAFSPDGTRLAIGSADGTVRLWEVASGRCLAILCAVGDGWIALRPDGRYRMAGDLRGGVWHAVNLCRFELGELDGYGPQRLGDDEPLLPRDALVDVRPAPPDASADVNPTPFVAPVDVRPAPLSARSPSPWPDVLAGAAALVGGTLALGATPTAAAAGAAAGFCAALASRAVRTRINRPR